MPRNLQTGLDGGKRGTMPNAPEAGTGTADSTVSRFTYRAFISYSHADKTWADWLHKALETYHVPSRLVGKQTEAGVIPRRLNPVFRDREELSSSPELGSKINQALGQSENLIVICSPASATSRWVTEEVLAYKRMGRGKRIFCLIVEGEPNATDLPGREAEECFCPALRFQLDANGQFTNERTEPIAADAREGKDGKANAKLKLIAGMLGVGFDALKQRELQRRTRRMTAIAALALVVMAITSVLAIYALISRHAAVIAEHQAQVAQQAAQRRQKQAEDLVNFLLGDLSTKLRQVDRLDILSSVDDKAMAYFKSLPATDVNATALAQRAKALQKIGEVRMDRSRLTDAMDAFQQALRLNKQLVDASPSDAMRQNAYAENLLWVGFADWNEGKADSAETAFRQSAVALERAVALAPSDNGIAHNLDEVYNNLGNVAQERGEFVAAHADFARQFALDARMAKQRTTDVLWQNALSYAYGNLGNVALAQGHLDVAVENFFRQHQVMTTVVARNPGNRQMQSLSIQRAGVLARALGFAGQTQVAVDYAREAVRTGAELVKFDPHHTDWQEVYGYYNRLLGGLLLEQGDIEAADKAIAIGLATATQLVAKDSDNAQWRSDLALAQLEGARLALARKLPLAAQKLAVQASENMQRLLEGNGASNTTWVRSQADIELLLGRLAEGTGDKRGADADWRQALARMRPLAAHSDDPRNLSIWVDALLRTGDKAQAKPAIDELRRIGYRPVAFVAGLRSQGIDYPDNPAMSKRIATIVAASAANLQAAQ